VEKAYIDMEFDVDSAKDLLLALNASSHPNKDIFIGRIQGALDRLWKPEFNQDARCECGHVYHRHFDSYENMEPIGCKYCGCWHFKEKND
jgi:hypothetical protein